MKKIFFMLATCIFLAGCSTSTPLPTATEIPTLTPTATPAYTPTPTTDPNILLLDDFSDDSSGWWEEINADGRLSYTNARYQIDAKESDLITWSILEDKNFTDGVYNIEYQILSGDEELTGVVIYWRIRDTRTFYFMQIWGGSYYAIGKYINDEFSRITAVRKTPLIYSDYQKNKVTIAFHESEADIYFNDNYVTSISDSSIKYGDIGLGVFPDPSSEVQAVFDNLAVYKYDPAGPFTPVKPEPTATPVYRSLTWDELVQFLIDDHTNWREYDLETYNCMDYAIDLIANAREENLKVWMVGVDFINDETGHAFVAFETADRGIIFVEPQGDNTYSHVEIGIDLCDDWGKYECYGIVENIEYIECDHDRNCTEYIP